MTINAIDKTVALGMTDGQRYSRPGDASYSGGVLTVLGSFPAKSTAAPIYFSDFESYSDSTSVSAVGLELLGDTTPVTVSTARAYTGTKSLRCNYTTGDAEEFPKIGLTGLNATQIYISCNFYWERYTDGTANAVIFKLCRAGSSTVYSGVPRFYETIRPNFSSGVIEDIDRGVVRDDQSVSFMNPNTSKANRDAWHRLEYRYKLGTAGVADGALQTYVNLVANANNTALQTRDSGSTANIEWVITPFDGMDHRGTVNNAYYAFIDNLYIDDTPIRVEVGDADTLAACTKRVVAVPSAWSTSAITAALNTSALGSGTRYVYVFDENNAQYGPAIEVTL